jgi:hypothetical protein
MAIVRRILLQDVRCPPTGEFFGSWGLLPSQKRVPAEFIEETTGTLIAF